MSLESIKKENFCEIVAIIYMSTMVVAIVHNGTDVFGLKIDGEQLAPFWSILIITGIVFVLWVACGLIRKKMP